MSRVDVYQVVSTETDKSYIGIAINRKRRWQYHLWSAANGAPTALHRAIRKYGKETFSMSHIATAFSWEDACFIEQMLIKEIGTKSPLGYNLTYGGEGNLGKEWSPEQRKRQSEIVKQAMRDGVGIGSPENKKLNAERGRSPEMRALASKTHKGRKLTERQWSHVKRLTKLQSIAAKSRVSVTISVRHKRTPIAMLVRKGVVGRRPSVKYDVPEYRHSAETRVLMSAKRYAYIASQCISDPCSPESMYMVTG